MQLVCPNCGAPLGDTDVNVANNVAFCRACSHAYQLSELVGAVPATKSPPRFDPTTNPPKGCWYRETMDGWTAGATTRSPVAFFLIPFMCVWSGGSLGGIYGSQIIAGKFDLVMSLFGIPFLLGSILFWSFAILCVAGKVELTARSEDLTIFAGVGKLGWEKKITITGASRVYTSGNHFQYPGSNNANIIIEGPSNTRFGSGLSFGRQMFLVQLLRYKFGLPD